MTTAPSSPAALGRAAAAVPNQPTPPRNLTKQFCFDTTTLKDFLRLSRSLDDTLLPALNALHTPSRNTNTVRYTSHHLAPIANSVCTDFVEHMLFPTWAARSKVLEYCQTVADGTEELDEDALRRKLEDEKAAKRVVDERLDPYSGRYFPRETKREVLDGVIRNEKMVETIVRERSWRLVGERCEGFGGEGWEESFGRWREEKGE
ncbi:hypothetical protein BJ508DRAFT_310447 [Ascobolus immersus RN42]|uniref:Caffeine-induced death protein Cid2 n=1 Tax=Ascobolus immersus RN42 TaxID=1160509 RepID=A0A3N4HTM1_ASCIM|nr:hypothetical protein BJ508DRAFT_310447 [Ascobolus immersus RN42]